MSVEREQKLVLLVDDDRDLISMLRLALENDGFEVLAAHDGREGLRLFFERRPDLAVLDIMLPSMDGWLVCERIREMSNTPVLMLTARTKDEEIARGLYLGADDYITKPFGVSEFMARVRAVVRRSSDTRKAPSQSLLTIDKHIKVDLAKRRIIVDGRPTHVLSPTEQRLLAILAAHAGEVVPSEVLVERVWGDTASRNSSHLKTYIRYLRTKLEPDAANPRYILTERGVGYRFEVRDEGGW